MSSLSIVIVIYNTLIYDIASWKIFYQYCNNGKVNIVVLDNSENKDIVRKNKQYSVTLIDRVKYLCNDGNIGLSKSYNRALQLTNSEWYFFADDDTIFSTSYIENVLKQISVHSEYCFCGIIKSNGRQFSPSKNGAFGNKKIDFISKPGIYNNIYAANSGLIISKLVLEKVGAFDESLFLDLVDRNLMENLKKNNLNKFYVLEGDIVQEFSGNMRISIKKSLPRFKIFSKDLLTFCKLNRIPRFVGLLIIIKRFVKIVFNSLVFIFRSEEVKCEKR